MARRTELVTINDPESRDHGKTFVITEMPAIAGERWAHQFLVLLKNSGMKLPDTEAIEQAGMQDIAALVDVGLPVLNALHDASLSEWWDYVAYQHKPNQTPQKIEQGPRCQIEEMATVTQLRMAFLKLHTDFFSPEKGSTSASPSVVSTGSSPTRISRPRSAQ